MCILSTFSRVRTAGTWPVHCVCSSYLVGCVICGGVAKGSGNVDSVQHNHMNLPPPAPALPPARPTRCQGAARVGGGRGPALCPHRAVSTTRSPSRLGKQAAQERGGCRPGKVGQGSPGLIPAGLRRDGPPGPGGPSGPPLPPGPELRPRILSLQFQWL